MPSKAKKKSKKKLKRPPRLIVSKDGKKRYLKVGTKKIRVKSNLSNEQLVNVVINNMVTKTKRRKYSKKKKNLSSKTHGDFPLSTGSSGSSDLKSVMQRLMHPGSRYPKLSSPIYHETLRIEDVTPPVATGIVPSTHYRAPPPAISTAPRPSISTAPIRPRLAPTSSAMEEADRLLAENWNSPPPSGTTATTARTAPERSTAAPAASSSVNEVHEINVGGRSIPFTRDIDGNIVISPDAVPVVNETLNSNRNAAQEANRQREEAEKQRQEAERQRQEAELKAEKAKKEANMEANIVSNVLQKLNTASNAVILRKILAIYSGDEKLAHFAENGVIPFAQKLLSSRGGDKFRSFLLSLGDLVKDTSAPDEIFNLAIGMMGMPMNVGEDIKKFGKRIHTIWKDMKSRGMEIDDLLNEMEEDLRTKEATTTVPNAPPEETTADSIPAAPPFPTAGIPDLAPIPKPAVEVPFASKLVPPKTLETPKSMNEALLESFKLKDPTKRVVPEIIVNKDKEPSKEKGAKSSLHEELVKKPPTKVATNEAVKEMLRRSGSKVTLKRVLGKMSGITDIGQSIGEFLERMEKSKDPRARDTLVRLSRSATVLNGTTGPKTVFQSFMNELGAKNIKESEIKKDFEKWSREEKVRQKEEREKELAKSNPLAGALLKKFKTSNTNTEEEDEEERNSEWDEDSGSSGPSSGQDFVTESDTPPDEERDSAEDIVDVTEEELDEADKFGDGKNKKSRGGLYDYQIEEIMKRFNKDGFAGVIASDEIHKLPAKKRMGFVMNLDKSNQPGSHWVAVYIDADRDKSIEYYDSYGKEPPKSFLKQIKSLVNKINPDSYLKFKVNKIVDQRANSDTCGWFAQKFLIDRFNGVPFKDTTGFSNVTKGEKNIKKMKEKYEEFGLI